MKLKVYWISFLVVIFLFVVIRNIPAHWALWAANAPVQMSGVTGTLWNGKAASAVIPVPDATYALGEVEWNLSFWSLLTAKPCATVKTDLDEQKISGLACVGLGGDLQLENMQVAVSAKLGEILVPVVEVQGDILMLIESLEFSNNEVTELIGSGSWSSAQFYNSTSWLKLGTIGFEFNQDGQGGIKAKVFDVEGPLKLELDSQFDLLGTYLTEGEVGLRPGAPSELFELIDNYSNVSREIQQVLSLFLEKKGRDMYSVRWVNPE